MFFNLGHSSVPYLAVRYTVSNISASKQSATRLVWRRYATHEASERKLFNAPDDAIHDIASGSVILSAGFGLCGTPDSLCQAILRRPEINNLSVVSNNAGDGTYGLSPLIRSKQISSMMMSYIGGNKMAEKAYLNGELGIELCPQGSLAERLRAGGAGIPGVYTRTGAGKFIRKVWADLVGTLVETGGIPIRYKRGHVPLEVEIPGNSKEVRMFNDRRHIFEPAISGDVALIRAWKVDKAGNCVFRYTTRSFGGLCARAARLTIVEADEIVEVGTLHPMDIDLPGIYVDRITRSTEPRRIEHKVVRQSAPTSTPKADIGVVQRERIGRRAAQELKDGSYCNLGIGMPTLAANFIPSGVKVWLQSENGIIGMGPSPSEDEVDPDIINAGKQTVTLDPGAAIFDSAESFAMIRGGHVDVSILGAMEVSSSGDLANYMIPGKLVMGMGGAMDLVSNPDDTRIVVVTNHNSRDGSPKIVESCTLPLTGTRCVSRIITELAVFDIDRELGEMTLVEIAEGCEVEEIVRKTGASFKIAEQVERF